MLKELDLDYVDLVLLHSPKPFLALSGLVSEEGAFSSFACKTPARCREETWKALAAARDRGKIKNLGVSNFGIQHFEEFKKNGLTKIAPIAVDQLPYIPCSPQWEKDVYQYCLDNGIAMTGYFSLGGQQSTGSTLAWDALADIAKQHKKSAAQILFRWSLQKGVAVIPGTGRPKHMKDNIQLYDFTLSEAEMSKIDTLGAKENKAWLPDMMNPNSK